MTCGDVLREAKRTADSFFSTHTRGGGEKGWGMGGGADSRTHRDHRTDPAAAAKLEVCEIPARLPHLRNAAGHVPTHPCDEVFPQMQGPAGE